MKKQIAFVYIRVSTKKQADEGYSIPEQIERLKKYAESMDWIIGHIYIDDGYTGSNMDRPELQNMLHDIESVGCDIVLVDKIDRLARNLLDTVTMVDNIFKKKDIAFVSRAESFDTSTPVGKACMVMMATFAEMEKERIAERMQDGKRGRKKEGLWSGGAFTPTGYVYDTSTGTLQIDEEKAEHVRIVFNLFADGMPFRQIERYMIDHGYSNGRGKFSAKSVKTIVSNKTYLGLLQLEGSWVEGKHAAIIDQDTFDRAAARLQFLKENKEPNSRGSYYYTTYFGNFIYCAHCGAKYIRTYAGSVIPGTNIHRKYYTCASKIKRSPHLIKDPNCKNKNWNVDKFDNFVFDEIRKINLNPNLIDNMQKNKDDSIPSEIDTLKKQLDNLSKQRSRLMDLYAIESIDLDELKSKLDNINKQSDTIRSDISILESKNINRLSRDEGITVIKALVDLLDNDGDMQAIRSMLSVIIDHITVDNTSLKIHWRFL